MVGLSGLTVTARGCWHGDDWARRDVQQPHHHTAQEQARNRPVPASAHDDQICSLLPSDVRYLMRGLGTDVVNDPETRSLNPSFESCWTVCSSFAFTRSSSGYTASPVSVA